MFNPIEIDDAINRLVVPKEWAESIIMGVEKICGHLSEVVTREINTKKKEKKLLLGIDGFYGIKWRDIISELERTLKEKKINTKVIPFSCYKSPNEIEKIVVPFLLPKDPVFGKIFDGRLEDFFDEKTLKDLKEQLGDFRRSSGHPSVLICFGPGAVNSFLLEMYDLIVYMDITRYQLTTQIQRQNLKNFGDAKSRELEYKVKRLYSIDYPVFEEHRKYLLHYIDFYVDANIPDRTKLLSRDVFDKILSTLSRYPIRPKPIYTPGVWGGEWLEKIRKLPKLKDNYSWSWENLVPEQSVKIALNDKFIEIPFYNLLWKEGRNILGDELFLKNEGEFLLCRNYDDSINGGDMSIQVHPHHAFNKKHFNEDRGQDESYYIVATAPGSKVHFGLQEDADLEEFYKAVKKAENEGIPFDHTRYVNSVPTKPGDYFMMPTGTIHGSGRNEVVLEIDSYIDRGMTHTFKLYDYLRRDLNGKLRPIHSKYAFEVINPYRRKKYVEEFLHPKPKLLRSGKDWAEYLVGTRPEVPYATYRLEFKKKIEDDTRGRFHVLTLVKGEKVFIKSKQYPKRNFTLNFSETVIIPACFKKYSITNLENSQCKIVKAFLK